jgi:diguanylate cyclase (GGDEF)-like protein/PAS domain S-box-containing protein
MAKQPHETTTLTILPKLPMPPNHTLLLKQLKKIGIENGAQLPSAEQWAKFLDRVSHSYAQAELERNQLEQSQEIASRDAQKLSRNVDEAQRMTGLGNWSYERTTATGRWSKQCLEIFGLAPGSQFPDYKDFSRRVHKDDRIDLKDRIDAAAHDGRNFEIEFRYLPPNQEMRWVRAIGQPVRDAGGLVVSLHGTVLDVTRRKLIELRQTMEHTVTRLLADSDSPDEVIPEIIQTVCETLGWKCGALWKIGRTDESLSRSANWSVPDTLIEKFFQGGDLGIKPPISASLIGRTLQACEPVWIADVWADPNFQRTAAAIESGLHAAFAFPIQAGGEVLGVMEFFTDQAQPADLQILRSAHFIGRHIGQFFQRKQAEDALRESEAHFRSLVEQATDSFYVHEIDGKFIDVNQRGCDSLGYTRKELLKMTIGNVDLDLSVRELKHLSAQITNRKPLSLESRYKRKDGTIFPVEIRMGPIEIGGRRHLLSLVRDVTERKELQDHIQHLAYHDPLTNLPNRAMFNRDLSHAILQAQRYSKGLALLFIDLDRFKNINDTLGHDAGDRLLQEMSHRISACLRNGDVVARLDGRPDMVARLGGDEFVVLIEEVTDIGHVSYIARKILTSMVKEFLLGEQMVHITASIGISVFPEDGRNEFSLMKHADIAMYRAKERGKNNFQFYSAQMDLHSAELLALESGLRRALERDEFVMYYQAKVETATGRINGVEALVRWQHPDLGLVSPVHFIPLAEESGLIVPLSHWVLNEACTQNQAWQAQGLPPMKMAVNLSARQFSDDDLLLDTEMTLQEVGMDPSLLELEVTESMMMYNTAKTIQILHGFRKMGIRIAIDDFGIGYSSLGHLKQFPVDILKIDRSFIKDLPGDASGEAITEAIIAIGKSMKIKVVAEGVETADQVEFLRQRGCDEIQGYFFSRPIPAADFAKLLKKNVLALTTRKSLSR